MAMSRSRLDVVEQSGWQSRLRREVALKSLDQIHIRVGRADRDENFSRHSIKIYSIGIHSGLAFVLYILHIRIARDSRPHQVVK
jgi:hypothetical protein